MSIRFVPTISAGELSDFLIYYPLFTMYALIINISLNFVYLKLSLLNLYTCP